MVAIVCPKPLQNMTTAKTHASGRNPCIPRAASGVRQNSNPHPMSNATSHSRNWNVGMGNQPQRSRRIVTVGLYTERKPVEASSTMWSANAQHSANHALPKPEAESAEGVRRMESTHGFSITRPAMAIEIRPGELNEVSRRKYQGESCQDHLREPV